MRWLALVLMLGLSVCQAQVSFSPQMLTPSPLGIVLMIGQWITQDSKRVYYIRVTGQGSTPEQARLNGFRLGVEQAVGTLIVSESEVANRRLQRDQITSYAAGFVDRFELIKTEHRNQQYHVTMDLWIGESALARRLLNQSAGTGTLDGARLAVQVETLQIERQNGDRLLETVLRDFPQRAFFVQVDKTQVDFNEYRNLQISVPVTLGWSREYYNALMEVFQRTRAEPVNCVSFLRVLTGQRADAECVARADRQASFNGIVSDDPSKLAGMIQWFTANKPAIEISVVDAHGRVLNKSCQSFLFSNLENQPYNIPNHYLFAVYNNSVQINPRYQLSGKLHLNLGANIEQIRQAERVMVKIVTENQCQKH